jgi:hypothetical protein
MTALGYALGYLVLAVIAALLCGKILDVMGGEDNE